jgi:hypothetical protein
MVSSTPAASCLTLSLVNTRGPLAGNLNLIRFATSASELPCGGGPASGLVSRIVTAGVGVGSGGSIEADVA